MRQHLGQIEQPDFARHERQHVAEVLERIDAGEPTRAEDRVRDRGAIGAGVGPGKQIVLPRHRGADVETLDDPLSIGT